MMRLQPLGVAGLGWSGLSGPHPAVERFSGFSRRGLSSAEMDCMGHPSGHLIYQFNESANSQ